MRLREYLEELRVCEDGKLGEKGLDNNFPIFLRARYNEIIYFLKKNLDYNLIKLIEKDYKKNHIFSYKKGPVDLQVINWIPPNYLEDYPFNYLSEKMGLLKKRFEIYNMTITLHPHKTSEISWEKSSRFAVQVLEDIARQAINNNLSLCLTETMAASNFSRIVFYPNSGDQQ